MEPVLVLNFYDRSANWYVGHKTSPSAREGQPLLDRSIALWRSGEAGVEKRLRLTDLSVVGFAKKLPDLVL
jgi:hypothetical protein